MKARIKATGDIVEVSLSHIIYDGSKKIIWYNTPQGASCTEDELEFFDTEENFDYWTRLEHQYAGMAMQGMISNEYTHKLYLDNKNYPNGLLNDSIAIAHDLIRKLKEKEERKWNY